MLFWNEHELVEFCGVLPEVREDSRAYDRTGAAYGLGFLKAKYQAKAVAKPLKDEEENVREAAKESLDMMGAAEFIKDKKVGKP
jgi:HEAT repeat protein